MPKVVLEGMGRTVEGRPWEERQRGPSRPRDPSTAPPSKASEDSEVSARSSGSWAVGRQPSHPNSGSGPVHEQQTVPTYSGGAAPASHRLPTGRDVFDDLPRQELPLAGDRSYHGGRPGPE